MQDDPSRFLFSCPIFFVFSSFSRYFGFPDLRNVKICGFVANQFNLGRHMGTSSKALAEKLRKLAKRQHGCFTAAQAVDIGYADSVHLYHVKTGNWIRVFRGVYRLAEVPESVAARCMAALLWTRDKNGAVQGVLAAETAEILRENVPPSGWIVPICVPKGFRRSSDIPEEIQISFVKPEEIITSKINGLPVLDKDQSIPDSLSKPPNGLDIADYYDWIDYQSALCPQTS
ncbi:MAG: type IV toxin-antitoxin system AbiEi family antitoxin domain-containing protein [Kiritimatiellia bacterium]